MSYQIVTVANRRPSEPYYTFDEFFKSTHGEMVYILGSQPGSYGGLGSKPRLLYHAIKNKHLTAKHLIFSDCFDVVFADAPSVLFEFYQEFNSPVVISSEKNCFPDTYKAQYDELSSQQYRYLNSGMIVGKTEAILAILEHIDAPNIPDDYWDAEKQTQVNPNDQEFYQKAFLDQPVKIVLDYDQILCNTLHSVAVDALDFSEDMIFNTETQTCPISFHFNGGAKTGGLREPILKHLNLL